jgi:hypothetical protein
MRPRPTVDPDRLIPLAVAASLIFASIIDASVRYYWVDEILTTTLVTDPSIVHMVRALADQVDTSPPLYYIVAWGWAHLFGAGALSLRLLSALFASAGFALLWKLLRPYASIGARAAMVCSALLLPHVVLLQVAEARSYGLLIGLSALVLYHLDFLSRTERPSGAVLVGVGVAQAALSLVHTFGVVYSVAALAALIVSDLKRGRRRIGVYLAWMAGWIAFVVWLPALRWQAQVGVPRFPIPTPTARTLSVGLALGMPVATVAFVLFLLVVAALVARRSKPTEEFKSPPLDDQLTLALGAMSWVVAAFAIWLLSRIWRPLFLPRYLVPLALAYAILGTLAFESLLQRSRAFARRHSTAADHAPPASTYLWLLAAVTAIALFEPLSRVERLPASNVPGGDSLEMRGNLPIAAISTHTYLPREYYAAHPERYVFILDWKTALAPDAPVGPTEYKLMAAMGRNYPNHWVEDGEHFLATHPRFLVIDEAGLFWFKRRVKTDSTLAVRLLYKDLLCGSGLPEDRCAVYLVERK